MNEGLEQLKSFGIQKVHEDTHISRKNIEGIFNQSFDGMNPVQFAGFISILEREYGLELVDLKRSFLMYWEERYGAETADDEAEVSTTRQPGSAGKALWMLGVAAAAGTAFYFYANTERTNLKPAALETAAPVEISIPETVPEPEAVTEDAVTEAAPAVAESAEPVVETPVETAPEPTLNIVPKTKLWIGLIDLETYKRDQKLTTEAVAVDTNHSWLMIFGHGHFKVEQGDEVLDYSSDNRLRFIYEEGTLREITRAEFKERNRGQNW